MAEDIIVGLFDLARTAENEHVRLGAFIELANRADGRPRTAKEDDEDDSFAGSTMSDEEFESVLGGDDEEDSVPETPPPDEGKKQEDVQANGSRFTELELD